LGFLKLGIIDRGIDLRIDILDCPLFDHWKDRIKLGG
jgi:hypothetical protein